MILPLLKSVTYYPDWEEPWLVTFRYPDKKWAKRGWGQPVARLRVMA